MLAAKYQNGLMDFDIIAYNPQQSQINWLGLQGRGVKTEVKYLRRLSQWFCTNFLYKIHTHFNRKPIAITTKNARTNEMQNAQRIHPLSQHAWTYP